MQGMFGKTENQSSHVDLQCMYDISSHEVHEGVLQQSNHRWTSSYELCQNMLFSYVKIIHFKLQSNACIVFFKIMTLECKYFLWGTKYMYILYTNCLHAVCWTEKVVMYGRDPHAKEKKRQTL